MTKSKPIILLMMILGVFLSIFCYQKVKTDDGIVNEVQLCIEGNEHIKLYKTKGILYAFIPSGIDLGDVAISCPKNSTYIDGIKAASGDTLGDFKLSFGNSYSLLFKHNKYEFKVLQSENVSTLFISNATGNFEEVLSDKKHKEPVRINLKDEKGNQLYTDVADLCGRGNSTWTLDKKPFNLYFENDVSLLGLGESKKYCLLANGFDESNLRDKLIYDFAKEVEDNWTPGCEYVDLYINGEYYGLYLLSESVQVSENKIDISPDSGYWYSMSIPSRVASLDDYVVTDDGRIVEVKYAGDDSSILLEHLNELETSLKNDGSEELIDIDSWVRTYLINEIFANTDICSLYFYWDAADVANKIYAGPQWDYDNALGNATCNKVKQISTAQIAGQQSRFVNYGNSWFSELANSPEFEEKYKEVYKNEYRSIIDDIIEHRIDDLSNSIEKASYCNSVRWSEMFTAFGTNDTTDDIKQYLSERVDFLDSKWVDGDEWCSIRINRGPDKSYMFFSVKEGNSISEMPDNNILGVGDIAYFIDENTGERFSTNEIINEDRCLKVVFAEDVQAVATGHHISIMKLICYMTGFLFFIALAYLATMDRRIHIGQQV